MTDIPGFYSEKSLWTSVVFERRTSIFPLSVRRARAVVTDSVVLQKRKDRLNDQRTV